MTEPPDSAIADNQAADDGPVVVPLASGRWRHLIWALLLLAAGLGLLWALGAVGKGLGALCLIFGALAARAFARTLLHDRQAIALGQDFLELPEAPCAPGATRLPIGEVRHAYLLRRAAPFLVAGPLLVVETGRGAFTFPRDWFETDADQRRLAAHINRRIGLP